MAEFITIADFADRAGVTPQAIYKRVDKDLQPFVKLVEGRKTIDTSALTLFNTNVSTETIEQPKSTDLNDDLIQRLKLENERLNNQLVETFYMLKKEKEENKKLTDQLITLSNDFSDLAKQSNLLASQSQTLQGHIQQRTLGSAENPVDKVDENFNEVDKPVEEPKRKGFFSKLFG